MQMGAAGMSSISGNFYPEILVWLCNHVNDESRQEDVRWIQSELQRVDPLIHIAYPLSAKYFLQLRGIPVRTISRAHALELTPEQKQTLQQIHRDFQGWCERLQIRTAATAPLPSH
jgi:4-hydroxy-tetrahydrodipicolinate synthase